MAHSPSPSSPALHDALVTAYVGGTRRRGRIVGSDVVRYGMDAGLAVRSAFTALPLDRLGEPVTDELAAFVGERLELTRYLVDLGLALPTRRRADAPTSRTSLTRADPVLRRVPHAQREQAPEESVATDPAS